jgi:hypothetical protein
MDAPDFPIEHFSLMRDLAIELKAIRAQILRHAYSYQAFGSWWMTIDHKTEVFRLVFDGREDMYSLERAPEREEPHQWPAPMWQLAGTAHELPIPAILAALLNTTQSPPG